MNMQIVKLSILLVALAWVPPAKAQEEEPGIDDGNVRCISTRRIRRTRIIDDQNVLIYLTATTIYHNVLRNACHGLERRRTFSYHSSDGLLCEGDGLSPMAGEVWGAVRPPASCWFGPHVKISKEDADAMRDAKKNGPTIEPRPLPMPEPAEVSGENEESESNRFQNVAAKSG
jgi:hypothetical protein